MQKLYACDIVRNNFEYLLGLMHKENNRSIFLKIIYRRHCNFKVVFLRQDIIYPKYFTNILSKSATKSSWMEVLLLKLLKG